MTWNPTSWHNKKLIQQVSYPCEEKRDSVISQLRRLPPLVTPAEIEQLKQQLILAAEGKAFLLQGGDCAESFADCTPEAILKKLRILMQISFVLFNGLHKPIIKVGRIAGQYAKPRSSEYETIAGITLPSYRGDLINGDHFDEKTRTPDPNRLLKGYQYSAQTLNYIRSLISSRELANILGMEAENLSRTEFYTSHEALHLYYEEALTREEKDGRWYNVGTHFPWVGMRTTTISSAHIEYIRGLANPIAIKIGPAMTPQTLIQLMERINPTNEPGKLTLIHRFGAEQIKYKLPPLIEMVKNHQFNTLWSCDPMHGNTTLTKTGYKTRNFDSILSELEQAIQIHRACHSYLGGVHFELTGDDVTECIGGAHGITEEDLKEAYHTLVDPRLNYHQSLEIALRLVNSAT